MSGPRKEKERQSSRLSWVERSFIMDSPDAIRMRRVRARRAQRKQLSRQLLLSLSKARRRAHVSIDVGAVEAVGSKEGDGDETRDDEVEGGFADAFAGQSPGAYLNTISTLLVETLHLRRRDAGER